MHKAIFAVGGALIGLGAGFFVGRKLTVKQLEAQYEQRLVEEIAATAAHINNAVKSDLARREPGATLPEEVKADTREHEGPPEEVLQKVVSGLRYGTVVEPKPQLPTRRVFLDRENVEDDEQWEQEVAARSQDRPYIISVDEFMEGEPNYSQTTLTYFVEDDTLIDEREFPIENVDRVVGEANLDRFGYKSNDPKVIYVRNEKLSADYEILRHEGSYGEVVHGVVTRREKQRPRKMRPE